MYCHYCAQGHQISPTDPTQHLVRKSLQPCRKFAVISTAVPGAIELVRGGQRRHMFHAGSGMGELLALASGLAVDVDKPVKVKRSHHKKKVK